MISVTKSIKIGFFRCSAGSVRGVKMHKYYKNCINENRLDKIAIYDFIRENNWKIYKTEFFVSDGYTRGKIDAIFKNSRNNLCIVDWKFISSTNSLTMSFEKSKQQILKYKNLYNNMFNENKITHMYICYIFKNNKYYLVKIDSDL